MRYRDYPLQRLETLYRLQKGPAVKYKDLEQMVTTRLNYAQADDVLDAVAAAWTALRVWYGTGVRMPERPALDARGLAMEIVA